MAGPVVAAAVILPRDFFSPHFALLHDSKQLSPQLRAALFDELSRAVECGVGVVDAATIDNINIRQASWLAMRRAVANLPQKSNGENAATTQCETTSSTRLTSAHSTSDVDFVLLDGLGYGAGPWPYEALVKGDARCLSIAAASVIAKETRDSLMIEFDAQFPHYGFARHKGYGTREHLAALTEHGICELHRRTFRPVREVLQNGS